LFLAGTIFKFVWGIVRYIFNHIIDAFLWFNKILMEKRTEAYFGFYVQLLLQINSLQSWLDERELLEINDPSKGNIYTLLYENKLQKKECTGFKEPSDEQLNDINKLASQIKDTFNNSKNNVYPKNSEKVKWYNSQQKLFEFCEFLENESMRRITNIAKTDGEYKHIVKCRDLVNAINYIKESIEKEIKTNKH